MRLQVIRVQEDWRQRIVGTAGIRANPETTKGPCLQCGGPTEVQKTVAHRVVTLAHGDLMAHETIHVCQARCRQASGTLVTTRSDALSGTVAPGKVYGYDLEVQVGIERFLRHRQREEIRRALAHRHGIDVSSGHVSALATRFLAHLEALHASRAPELRAALDRDGGYPLHLDATGEDGRGTMLVALAGWRRWVLGAWKIPTERAEFIRPAIQAVAAVFGTPRVIMRDLGAAMREAAGAYATALAIPIGVLACHLHFLSDIGTDLLDAGHNTLRDLFRHARVLPQLRAFSRQEGRRLGTGIDHGRDGLRLWLADADQPRRIPDGTAGLTVVRSLAQWILDYRADGSGQGFPFDLPYRDLHHRCLGVACAAEAFGRDAPTDAAVRKALDTLQRILRPVRCDIPRFHPVGIALDRRATLFAELRRALRLEETGPAPGAGSAHDAGTLHDIRSAVDALTTSLRTRRPERGPAQDLRTAIDLILAHLDRHGPHLWGHVLPIPEACGGGVRLVDRTNNILESWFGALKQRERRRSGRKVLTQDFERLPPAAALAVNLNCPDYVQILCGSLDDLPSAFARLDAVARDTPAPAKPSIADPETASLSTRDRRFVRIPALEQRITAAALSR